MEDNEEKVVLLSAEPQRPSKWRYIFLEIITTFHFAAYASTIPIQQFIVIDKIAEKYPDYSHHNVSGDSYCPIVTNTSGNNSSDTSDKVQSEAASVLTYLGFIGTMTAVIPILILGSLTDKYGRKFTLIISIVGLLIKEIVMLVTVLKDLPTWVLVFGEVSVGVAGSFGLTFASVISMIADITKPDKERAFRITVMECVIASSVALAILGVGFWIKDGNYAHPLIMCVAFSIMAAIFSVTILPETLSTEKRSKASICSKEMVKSCVSIYKKDKRRLKLIIAQTIFCVNVGALIGKSNVITLFLLHHPLCWSEVHVQVFNAIQTIVNWIVIIIGIKFLHAFISDYSIVIIGTLSALAGSVVLAFSQTDFMVYLYALVGIMAVANSPMLRSLMSRMVKPNEQGGMFACLGSSELLLTSLGQLFYGFIYKDTVQFFPGLVFLLVAGIIFIEFILSIVLYLLMKKSPGEAEETVVVVS